jgi:glycosyltransferase involved in cell wall biosynthesis
MNGMERTDKRRTKICFLATSHSIHTQRWIEYLSRRGYEVHLICFSYQKIKNAKIHVVKERRSVTDFFMKLAKIKEIIKKINPDILHAHFVSYYGKYAAFCNFHPLILSVWGEDILIDSMKSFLTKILVSYSLKKADYITTTSSDMKKRLTKDFNIDKKKIASFSWGINHNVFYRNYKSDVKKLRKKLKISKNSRIVLSPRSMRELSNTHYIVKSIPEVIGKYPNTIFIFLGGHLKDSSYEARIISRINELKVTKNVRIISEPLTPKEMAAFYNLSDIFISIPFADQLSSTLLEGMACGSIPLVSNLPVYKERIRNNINGFIISNLDRDLAKTIINCLSSLRIKSKIYKLNKKMLKEKDDWDKNAKILEQIYTKLKYGCEKKLSDNFM